jgi:general secretion pathway protein E
MRDSSKHETVADKFFTSIPIELCRCEKVCLTKDQAGTPILAVAANSKPFVTDSIRRFLGFPIHYKQQSDDCINILIDNGFENHQRRLVKANQRSKDSVEARLVSSDGEDLLKDNSNAPVIDLVNRIFFEAVQLQASDIHFQPRNDSMVVRMRLDGILFDMQELSKDIQEEVLTRIKVAGRMDIAEKRLPQDGRATVRVGSRVIDLRIASMPASNGERIVVRLLDKSARLYTLPELGMDDHSLQAFRQAISVEHGLILVTGPTGSGKSTTLYAALQELDTTKRNAVTLEDPIEYQLDKVSQTQINLKKGMTFASGLRSVLRQDPDIIMVGEIRDAETALMAVQAALTGHLVFSTLHTNDAASAVTRMLDLGIEPYLLASSLVSVLAQRLVRRVCPSCNSANSESKQTQGCDSCRQTGYKGRLGIYELMIVDEATRSLITKRSHSSELRDYAVSQGMKLLSDSGNEKIAQGLTTQEEVAHSGSGYMCSPSDVSERRRDTH